MAFVICVFNLISRFSFNNFYFTFWKNDIYLYMTVSERYVFIYTLTRSFKINIPFDLNFFAVFRHKSMVHNIEQRKSGFNGTSNYVERDVDRRTRDLIKALLKLKELSQKRLNYILITMH